MLSAEGLLFSHWSGTEHTVYEQGVEVAGQQWAHAVQALPMGLTLACVASHSKHKI